ncbi:uncharacterized protein BDR25DRAFT_11963 [Lindgomyces ingoldianus]|uniref:Uncharacterized protein n=1 Tax=Lindgomyces ingoldianus TaxID=673940 RepID=A0ACB6R104_9PLEO|nr:uncharacterized protein BDR25DRAFT_11963 [Lindgomyces ingoldianus]KAF2472861.1 hypothetical protein BDR25DRAFT_11963 [Lindgomyces ingoldianus]
MKNATELLPWGWTITPKDDSLVICPSASKILGTFALVNIVVTALSVVFGNRYTFYRLTGRRFFKNKNSKLHRVMWIVNVALQLGANALIGRIFQKTPGYNADFKIWELMLFFTVRPRLSWIVLMLLSQYEVHNPTVTYTPVVIDELDVQREGLKLEPQSKDRNVTSLEPIPKQPHEKDRPWASTAKSQAFAEIALQIIALYIMGKTAHFASTRRYYLVGTAANKSLPAAAKIMYGGALYYLIMGVPLCLYEIFLLVSYYTGNLRGNFQGSSLSNKTVGYSAFIFYNLSYTWLGSWLFWAGFVRLAGDLYCPPKLHVQGSIWGAFSLIGIILGVGGV